MKTTLIKTACLALTALLAVSWMTGCEQKSDELIRAQRDGAKKAAENLAAHEKRMRRMQQ